MSEPSFEQIWETPQPPAPAPPAWKTAPLTVALSGMAIVMSLLLWKGQDLGFAFEDDHIWAGQYWRFVLSSFIHANIWHLVFNLLAGWDLGRPLEQRYGSARMLALFLLLAIGSGAAQFLSGAPGIGMSGVIYGYFGLILGGGRSPNGPRLQMQPKTIMVVLGWLVLCVVMTRSGAWNIGNVAHIAGLGIGLGLGWALRANQPLVRLSCVAGIAVALAPATMYMPWDSRWWFYRGTRYEERGEAKQTEACYRKAIDKAGDGPQRKLLILHMGYRAFGKGAYDEAMSWYAHLKEGDNLKPAAPYLAMTYLAKGEYDKARVLLRLIDPDDLDESMSSVLAEAMKWARSTATDTAPTFATTLPEMDEEE